MEALKKNYARISLESEIWHYLCVEQQLEHYLTYSHFHMTPLSIHLLHFFCYFCDSQKHIKLLMAQNSFESSKKKHNEMKPCTKNERLK